MTHVLRGFKFCELAKIRYYGGINFPEVEKKIAQNGYMTGNKKAKCQKNSINFPKWRKSEHFTFKRSFSNFESHKLSQIRPKFEETTKLSAPESFCYFVHNYSRGKLLQTTLSVFNFVCINFCDWRNFASSQFRESLHYLNFARIKFLWKRQQNSVFLLYFTFFQNFSFCSSKKRARRDSAILIEALKLQT